MKTIFLCGFMGCGKSTVGRRLAALMGCSFTDMDTYIEETEGMSIPDIFAQKGEPYFRDCESKAISELGAEGGVIACGGGAMLREENSAVAKRFGEVIFIDVPFETCYERIAGDENRPIVMSSTKESLEDRYNGRIPVYRKHSTVTVPGGGSPEEIARLCAEIASAR
ncbi:MAG: shikimate kinase [Oscillospiraceae bacterium]|nr:shikimate kinase [Oscillospiraceae bacterium]